MVRREENQRAKHCRYCRREITAELGRTVDHIIPKVVTRWGSRLQMKGAGFGNKVACCLPCNQLKGSMPVVEFLQHRFDVKRVKALQYHWANIHRELEIIMLTTTPAIYRAHDLAKLVVTEFSKPIPEHFVTGTKAIEIRQGEPAAHRGMFLE